MEAWNRLPFKYKLGFINLWTLFSLVGHLAQIYGGVIYLVSYDINYTAYDFVSGSGCFFAWVSLLGYFEENPSTYVIIDTLRRGAEILVPYTIGVLPIFIGYTLLGMSLFWVQPYYRSFSNACISGVAMMYGDSVYMYMSAFSSERYILGQLFGYFYFLFFIACVFNLFLAILERGYASLITRPIVRNYGLFDKQEKPKANRL